MLYINVFASFPAGNMNMDGFSYVWQFVLQVCKCLLVYESICFLTSMLLQSVQGYRYIIVYVHVSVFL